MCESVFAGARDCDIQCLHYLRMTLSLSLEIAVVARPTGQQASEVYLSPPPSTGVTDVNSQVRLLHGFWGPHVVWQALSLLNHILSPFHSLLVFTTANMHQRFILNLQDLLLLPSFSSFPFILPPPLPFFLFPLLFFSLLFPLLFPLFPLFSLLFLLLAIYERKI